MAATHAGGLKAAETNVIRYGMDFYKRIGAKGGANGHTGGFYQNRDLASAAGRLGGVKSRRLSSDYGNAKWRKVNEKKLQQAYDRLLIVQIKARQEREMMQAAIAETKAFERYPQKVRGLASIK